MSWLAPYAYRETDGTCVGRHRGAHFFTIGQRKGLNVGGKPEPLFVIATDVERNVLYVGQGQRHPGLYRRGLRILPDEMHWVRPDRALQPGASARFRMRIRYRQPLQDGVLHVTPEGRVYRVRRAAARRYGRAVRLVVRRRGIDRIGGDSLLRQVRPADAGRVKRSGERPKTLPLRFVIRL